MDKIDVINTLLGGFISFCFGWMLWNKKKSDDRVNRLEDRVIEIEKDMVILSMVESNQRRLEEEIKKIGELLTDVRIVLYSGKEDKK